MGKRICHVITGLERAGAQRVLVDLLAHHDRSTYDVEVISLLPRDALAEEVEAHAPLWCADLDRDAGLPLRAAALVRHLAARRPSLVHTWMYHGDVIGGLAAKLARRDTPVVWHLHHGTLDFDRFRPSTRALAALAGPLSRTLPHRIIACAESSRRLHSARGYDDRKMIVIRNGVDTARHRPRPPGPRPLVAELGLTEPVRLVGLAARFHPQKDHATFLAAARHLAARRPDVHFVLCGRGVDATNPAFAEVAGWDRLHLLGERTDVADVLAQLDVSGLSSAAGEACSLVLLESMAAGIPCVTTDVGDSAALVGDTGRVVPPRDPRALADAWASVLALDDDARRALGRAARHRAEAQFSLGRVAQAIEAVYAETLSDQ